MLTVVATTTTFPLESLTHVSHTRHSFSRIYLDENRKACVSHAILCNVHPTLHARVISTRKISNSLVAVYGVRHTTTFQMRDGSNISISGLDDTHISVLDLCIWRKIQCYARSCSPSVVYRYVFVHTEGIEIGTAIVWEYKQQNRKKTLMLI